MPGTFGEKKIFEILSSSGLGLFQDTSTREVQHSILNLFLDENHTLGLTLSTRNFVVKLRLGSGTQAQSGSDSGSLTQAQ